MNDLKLETFTQQLTEISKTKESYQIDNSVDRFIDSNGRQIIDTSFIDTNMSLKQVVKFLENQLPTPEQAKKIEQKRNWWGGRIYTTNEIDKLYDILSRKECDSDMKNRIFNNEYLFNDKGYVLSGSCGLGKTTKLLTHFAGLYLRLLFSKEKAQYLDWTSELNDYDFWGKTNVNLLLQDVKYLFINDLFYTDIKSGYKGDENKDNIKKFFHACYSKGVKLYISTNCSKEDFEEMARADRRTGAMLDRLPSDFIEFNGKSFRG